MHRALYALSITAALFFTTVTHATDIAVDAGQSIQEAIHAATTGDTILIDAGTFHEDIDFLGKAITVRGVGPETVLQGTGTGPVVTFNSGESSASILDSVTITGGVAEQGGGIFIRDSSPVIVRTVITQNRASRQGSGVYIEGSGTARLYNNLITYNRHTGNGDPHGIEIVNAAPLIINNTIARGDSNGLIIRGATSPVIMNNIIALNGALVNGAVRGRGICDFSRDQALISYNDFFANRIAALLRNGQDWALVRTLQETTNDPRVTNNIDGSPKFRVRRPPVNPALADYDDFLLSREQPRRATNSGNPHPLCNDRNGTRNNMGFTGGPFAPGSTLIPDATSCGTF